MKYKGNIMTYSKQLKNKIKESSINRVRWNSYIRGREKAFKKRKHNHFNIPKYFTYRKGWKEGEREIIIKLISRNINHKKWK